MLEFLEDNFLSQLVSEPTRENNILDLVIVSQDRLISNVKVGEHFGSCDHKLVRADISTLIKVLENKTLVPIFRRGNFEDLRLAILHLQLPNTAQVDEAWSYFKNQLLTQQRNFIPYCERRPNNKRSHHWFNNEIKRTIQERNKLYKYSKAQNSSENMRLYNESRRRVKTLIKQAKRQYEENIAAESKHNAKMFLCTSIARNILEEGSGHSRTTLAILLWTTKA